MLRTDLPKIITETVPGPKSRALIDRRKAATPSSIGCVYPVAIERGEGDLVLTNEYIYKPYFGSMDLGCDVIYQEKYGAGEPSDEMAADAAVHALSYPLGATFHVADGEIAKLNRFLADILECPVRYVYEELEKLLNVLIPKKALREYGVTQE